MFVWMVIACVVIVIVGLRYFLAPYLLAEHPDYKARAVIREGVKLVRGYKGSVFLFALSFILWYLPSLLAALLVLFIPFSDPFYLFQVTGLLLLLMLAQLGICFYLVPYQSASLAMYARYLIQTGRAAAWTSMGTPPGNTSRRSTATWRRRPPGARGRTARAAAGRGGNRRFRTGGGSVRLTGHKSKEREKHRT